MSQQVIHELTYWLYALEKPGPTVTVMATPRPRPEWVII